MAFLSRSPSTSRIENVLRLLTIFSLLAAFIYLFVHTIEKLRTAPKRPFTESSIEIREGLHVPGVVICGPNINVAPKCHLGPIGLTGKESNKEWWKKMPLKEFRYVYQDSIGEEFLTSALDCYVMLPPDIITFTPGLNEQMQISIYSNETTKAAPFLDRWVFFGVFWPWMKEDPRETRVDMFNIPSVTLITFNRRELYRLDDRVEISYDATTSHRMVNEFKNDTAKWGVVNLRPDSIPKVDGYVVSVQREYPSFQSYDVYGIVGGNLVLLYLIYCVLWGQQRLDPYGVVQKYLTNTAQTQFPSKPCAKFGDSASEVRRNRAGTPLPNNENHVRSNLGSMRIPKAVYHRPNDVDNDTDRLFNITSCSDAINDPPPPFNDFDDEVLEKIKKTEEDINILHREFRYWMRVLKCYLVIRDKPENC